MVGVVKLTQVTISNPDNDFNARIEKMLAPLPLSLQHIKETKLDGRLASRLREGEKGGKMTRRGGKVGVRVRVRGMVARPRWRFPRRFWSRAPRAANRWTSRPRRVRRTSSPYTWRKSPCLNCNTCQRCGRTRQRGSGGHGHWQGQRGSAATWRHHRRPASPQRCNPLGCSERPPCSATFQQ